MEDLTIVIPFYEGHGTIGRLLQSIPPEVPVIVVDDQSEHLFTCTLPNVRVFRPDQKLYFTGAVNFGIRQCATDVLVLNQDSWFEGTAWLDMLAEYRQTYALIGERIHGPHPAFPGDYVHGTFQFMRRDAIASTSSATAGPMNETDYPLWGASALWQWQICRKGFRSLPVDEIPGFHHERQPDEAFGSSIRHLLTKEPDKKAWLIRTPPMVSVVIPAYNHARFLPDAINSLIGGPTSLGEVTGQTFQSFEVIIVNDGSDGSNSAQTDALKDQWKGVRVIHQRNAGSAVALNTGIRAAVGKYICRLDADDMREPWSLADLYAACEANPHCYAYCEPTLFGDGERRNKMRLEDYDFNRLIILNSVPSGIMFPKQAWREAGGYPTAGVIRKGREDWAMNIALGRKGWHGCKVEQSGYLYRRHETNRTLRNTSEEWKKRFAAQMLELFPDVYRRKGIEQMAGGCCGGGKAPPQNNQQAHQQQQATIARALEQMNDMVAIEYIGGNVGSTKWGGVGSSPSGKAYVFGKNARDQVKYVDPRDVDWLLARRIDGAALFRVRQPEPVAPTKTEPEQADGIDPSKLTVAEIKALDLTPNQWEALAVAEKAGRKRVGVLEFVEEALSAESA